MAQKDHGDAPISAAQVDLPAVSHESESKLLTDSHEILPMSQDTASQAHHDLLLREDHQAVSQSLTSGPSTLQSQVSQFQKPRIFWTFAQASQCHSVPLCRNLNVIFSLLIF